MALVDYKRPRFQRQIDSVLSGLGSRRTHSAAVLPHRRRAISIRPDHFEHGAGGHLEIIAAPASAPDREGGLREINALLDGGLVDMDGDGFAERQAGLRWVIRRALVLDDVRDICA